MIYQSSRYKDTTVYDRDGVHVLKMRRTYDFRPERCTQHRVSEHDTIDGLARTFYGDEQLWWVLMEANVGLNTPLDLVPGMTILVPLKDEVTRVYVK